MKLLFHSFSSPFENIAFEEQYFRTFKEETVRLWINPVSVICGKHQNAYSETDYLYCLRHNIPVIRRLSGGGTVFHDLGNINFSFFRFVDKHNPIDYQQNLEMIKEALGSLGYTVSISPRNDLFLGDCKISGNAQHISRGRAIHHGTILYDSHLNEMKPSINHLSGVYTDKSVKSVPSRIQNLRKVKDVGSAIDFAQALASALRLTKLDARQFYKVEADLLKKYSSDQWNIGYGPKYDYANKSESVAVELSVDRGGEIIDFNTNNSEWKGLKKKIVGKKHLYSELAPLLQFERHNNTDLLELLF